MPTTTDLPPRRTKADLRQLDLPELQREARQLLDHRQALTTRRFPDEVGEIIIELNVMRRIPYAKIAQRLGVSAAAVNTQVAPLRKRYDIDRAMVERIATGTITPPWPRPHAKRETAALLDRLAELHAAGTAPDPVKIERVDKRLRPYLAELTHRPRPEQEGQRRGQWKGKTSLTTVAAELGTTRPSLARILGWTT